MKNDIMDKIKGALYGVAVGDALGAPLEFMNADQIDRRYGRVTEMIGGGWLGVLPGEVTDDTQMTLAVAEGIVASPKSPTEEVGARFIEWARGGPKDIGGTCRASISNAGIMATKWGANANRPSFDVWEAASRKTAFSNGNRSGGNGALMRTVYPGLYYRKEWEAVQKASDISRMTHWDDESDDACQLYTHIIHRFIQAEYPAVERTEQDARDAVKSAILRSSLKGTQYDIGKQGEMIWLKPTGYVVDSMKCAVSFFWNTESFEEAVADAANYGGDADTIAAITGGLAGAYYGYNAIPTRWTGSLAPEIRARLDVLADLAADNRANGR